jgi:cell division protein FtsL
MRNPKQRKISLFNLMIMLFIGAGIIIFFVNNIIAVNSLVVDNNNIQTEINKTTTINNGLQTEVERLSNFDNIKNIAVYKLGLKYSTSKPKKVTVEKSQIENVTDEQ